MVQCGPFQATQKGADNLKAESLVKSGSNDDSCEDDFMDLDRAVNEGLQVDIDKAVEIEEKLFGSCFESEDQRNGMAAFLNKEKAPAFQNK